MDSNDSNVTLTGFSCSKCSKQIKRKNNLIKHEQNCLASDDNIKNGVTCPDCKQVFGRLGFLRIHVQDVHKIPQEVEEKYFETKDEFEEWKTRIEKETLCFYFKKRKFTEKGQVRTYLYCHRSGFFKTESKGVRRSKKETNKIDATCISTMIVTENARGIGVVFHKTHFGHDIDLDKCYLTPEERAMIAGTPDPDKAEKKCSAKSDDIRNDNSSQIITNSTDICELRFISVDSFPNNLDLCYEPEINVINENMDQSDSELIIYHSPSDYEKKKQDIVRKIDIAKDTFLKNKYTPEELNSVFTAVDNVLELMTKKKRKTDIVEENEPANKLMKNQSSLSSKTKRSKKSTEQSRSLSEKEIIKTTSAKKSKNNKKFDLLFIDGEFDHSY